MRFIKNALIYLHVVGIVLFSGCNEKKREKFPDTDMYELSSPKVVHLPDVLDEISGIAYYPKDTSVFGIVDEEGVLFKVPLKNPKSIRYWEFDKKRDFEELVLKDSVFYALVSNGDIVSIRFIGDSIHTEKSNFSDDKKTIKEFESMYLDGDSALVIICKECDIDTKAAASSFAYDYKDTSKKYREHLQFKMDEVINKIKLDKHFKASAAAIHPLSGDIYLISAIQKLLMITDKEGNFKEVYKLNPKIYKQPEGITFTPEGDLIISNEFGEVGYANLLLMKYKKKKVK